MSGQLRKFRMICKHENTKQRDVKNVLNLILVRKVYNNIPSAIVKDTDKTQDKLKTLHK